MRNSINGKVFGEIKGIPVGTRFRNRDDLAQAGVHGRPRWGIHGTPKDGAYAIVLNKGYEDDKDLGETILYTGQGKGMQTRLSITQRRNSQTHPMSLRSKPASDGPQVGHQKWIHGNLALRRSHATRDPVRVTRGPDGNVQYCPRRGFRYDDCYEVVGSRQEEGLNSFMICRFELERLEGQAPLPSPDTSGKFWEPDTILPDKKRSFTPTPSRKTYNQSERKAKLHHLAGSRNSRKLCSMRQTLPSIQWHHQVDDDLHCAIGSFFWSHTVSL